MALLAQNFTVDEFLKTIPEKDPKGNEIPQWKRYMLAKKSAEKAKKDAEDLIRKEFEEKLSRQIPEWKKQLLKKDNDLSNQSMNINQNQLQQNNGNNYIR